MSLGQGVGPSGQWLRWGEVHLAVAQRGRCGCGLRARPVRAHAQGDAGVGAGGHGGARRRPWPERGEAAVVRG